MLSSVLHIRLACILATTLCLKYNVHRGVHNTDTETAQKKEKSIVILQGVVYGGEDFNEVQILSLFPLTCNLLYIMAIFSSAFLNMEASLHLLCCCL